MRAGSSPRALAPSASHITPFSERDRPRRGGDSGDKGGRRGLDGALMRPRTYHDYEGVRSLYTLATMVCQAIAKAHVFVEGNPSSLR